MDAPERIGFLHRLAEARRAAITRGSLTRREYDSLLADVEFEDDAFEGFRTGLMQAGVVLPEDEGAEGESSKPDRTWSVGEPERDILDLYLDEIGRVPLLSHADLIETAKRSRAGDDRARKAVILANLRLVVYVARNYQNRGLALLDLIEEGNLGLIHAVDRFDPERGLRFSTYATLWIRQSIVRGLAEQSRSVRIPVQMFQQMNRFVRVSRSLRAALGREPAIDEVARELEIAPVRAERLQQLVAGLRPPGEGDGVDAFEELSAEHLGEAPPSVERMVELQLEHEKLDRLLRTLSVREEQVIRIRYGFHDGVARTLQETGEHFGITRERVRQIEARALEKLRRAIELADADRFSPAMVH